MFSSTARTLAIVFATGIAAAAPLAASAQVPTYATQEETIKGTIVSIDGAFGLTVRDERGFLDKVVLHQGTIINPTGLTLAPGQTVTILGRTTGNTFSANEVDTPYQTGDAGGGASYYGYAPYAGDAYAYGYGGYGAGYGGYGFGYPYYGSSIALGIGGYYPAYGYGYYGHGYYPHGYYGHGNAPGNAQGAPVPYHTYPYHNPAPPASSGYRATPQSSGGYHGFGTTRSSGGGYSGFSGGGARAAGGSSGGGGAHR